MLYSLLARAAVASLFIHQIAALPQGRGSEDDTRTLSLPTPEEAASALGLPPIPTTTHNPTTTAAAIPTPTTLLTTTHSSPSANANANADVDAKAKASKKDLAARGEGNCKAIVYSSQSSSSSQTSEATSGLRLYRNGDLLSDVPSIDQDSWSSESVLPSPVLVHVAAEAPGVITSCTGSYADQTDLEGWVGAGYEYFEGFGAGGRKTCEMDFQC